VRAGGRKKLARMRPRDGNTRRQWQPLDAKLAQTATPRAGRCQFNQVRGGGRQTSGPSVRFGAIGAVGRLVSGRARQWSLWAPAFSVGAPLRWPADCLPYTVLPTLYTAQSVQHTVYSVQCAPQTVCRCSTAAQCTVLIAECTWPTCSTHNSLAGALLAPHRRRKRKTITLE